jgi:hypothetical protein
MTRGEVEMELGDCGHSGMGVVFQADDVAMWRPWPSGGGGSGSGGGRSLGG